MGTRSITTIIDNQFGRKAKILTMYRQFDGYPSGHGKELAVFLNSMQLCNGLGGKAPEDKVWANGAGCLGAQMLKYFKEEPGGIYVTAPRVKLEYEDYSYVVTVTEELKLHIEVRSYSGKIFDGTLEEFGVFCSEEG